MTVIPLEIGTQSNPGRHGQDGAARIINGYPEMIGKEGKHPIPVYVFAGLTDFATLVDGGTVRAMINLGPGLYVVAGRAIYRVDGSGTGGAVPIGGLASDGPVTMSANRAGQILVVCDGTTKKIEAGAVSEVATPAPFKSVTFLGGYFVCSTDDGRYFYSGIDAVTFDALDFKSAEASSDNLLTVKTLGQQIVLFGERTIEFHSLTTDAEDPFQRAHVIQVGLYTPEGVVEIPIITKDLVTDSLVFVAADRQGAYAGVCLIDNMSARKISNEAVDRAIRDEPDKLSITTCSWSDAGHAFCVISGASFTYVYDTATGQWPEKQSYGLKRWKVRSVQFFAGKLIAGDYTANKLYWMHKDAFTEGSDPLIMTIQTPPVHSYPNLLDFLALYIDVIPGVGLANGAAHNVNPEIMVQWSDDGINWSQIRTIPIGILGQTLKRVKTNRLGQSKRGGGGRTFRFSISAAVAKGIMGAALDVNQLAA